MSPVFMPPIGPSLEHLQGPRGASLFPLLPFEVGQTDSPRIFASLKLAPKTIPWMAWVVGIVAPGFASPAMGADKFGMMR